MNNIPQKPFDADWLVYDEASNGWVPNVPFPEDADLIINFGPKPQTEEVEVTLEDGSTITMHKIILPDNPKVYRWNMQSLSWELSTKQLSGPTN